MKDLAVRLAALDADAGAALRVISYFDRLAEARAGLHAIVRGAVVLAEAPARLVDEERRVRVRIGVDGQTTWWTRRPTRPGCPRRPGRPRSGWSGPVRRARSRR